ncbi:Qat anti-phage system QueC-like protein QatC [Halobacteriovorax sp. XZX-3]|uniref:Qat anti-phage system QueC-like protein QatC n=1 Tax=unclassified Halobacteriovorax TaxID=2639665 RepID=UPI003722D134
MANILVSTSEEVLLQESEDLEKILLFGRSVEDGINSCGAAVIEKIKKLRVNPDPLSIDFLGIALSVLSADKLVSRNSSPDGWTRIINLSVPVMNLEKWNSSRITIEKMLRFLTTDIWNLSFYEYQANFDFDEGESCRSLDGNCVTLLSGGMDSLIGLIDLVSSKKKPIVVSQIVKGDSEKQQFFVEEVNAGLEHLQFNHNVTASKENSTRSRSIIFLAYGIMAATCLENFKSEKKVKMFICENGLISLNPPLTSTRVGSLSTRTTNPVYMSYLNQLLEELGLNVEVVNPYQFKTKGEMCVDCRDQVKLKKLARLSTSCGRFGRYGFTQCGRCFPCLIRRSSFKKWGQVDRSTYFFKKLGKKDKYHSGFDDVRSASIAVSKVTSESVEKWIGPILSNSVFREDKKKYISIIQRGIKELELLMKYYKIL